MQTTAKVIKYELSDVIRSKWIVLYALFFLIVTEALFQFGGGSARALLSLSNLVLIIIPLISILFGTMYLYNARDFVELLLTQPVDRKTLFGGLYTGLAGLPLLLTGVLYGGINWLAYAWHGQPAPTGTVVIPAMLVILGFQLLLSCLTEDLRRTPRQPLSASLLGRAGRDAARGALVPPATFNAAPPEVTHA